MAVRWAARGLPMAFMSGEESGSRRLRASAYMVCACSAILRPPHRTQWGEWAIHVEPPSSHPPFKCSGGGGWGGLLHSARRRRERRPLGESGEGERWQQGWCGEEAP